MAIPKSDLYVETMRGKGPGGQHKNKTDSAVRITHKPTGIVVYVDGRKQSQNKSKAMRELKKRLKQKEKDEHAAAKKALRDKKIKETQAVRTYDYTRGIVTDRRTKKQASLKHVMDKGRVDLLWDI